MDTKSKGMSIFLIISLLVLYLTLNYKIPFFDYAIAQQVAPGLNANLSTIGNETSSFGPSSNQTFNTIKSLSSASEQQSQNQPSYIVDEKISVQANKSGSIGALCQEGDGLVIGGYSLNTSSDGGRSLSNAVISANFPVISNSTTQSVQQKKAIDPGMEAQSPTQEGWITGVINNGDKPLELVVNTLCLNLKQ